MKKNLKRGFTLIELLVVVAIIGLLASVVLASLNIARSKGSDAAVKSELDQMRSQAELNYDTCGCYSDVVSGACGTACAAITPAVDVACPVAAASGVGLFKDAKIFAMYNQASNAGGFCAVGEPVGGAKWAADVQLNNPTSGKGLWCVDSAGNSKEIDSATAYTQATVTSEVSGGLCN